MILPGLSLLERLAIWMLHRSGRVTLLVVKSYAGPEVFVSANLADPIAAKTFADSGVGDPPSMVMERMFHAPSYGEDE